MGVVLGLSGAVPDPSTLLTQPLDPSAYKMHPLGVKSGGLP